MMENDPVRPILLWYKNYADISLPIKCVYSQCNQKKVFCSRTWQKEQAMYKLIEPGYSTTLEYKTEELNLAPVHNNFGTNVIE